MDFEVRNQWHMGFTHERDTMFKELHVSEIKSYNVKCVIVFQILTLRYH